MAYDLVARLRLIDEMTSPLRRATGGLGGVGKVAVGVSAAIAGIGAAIGALAVVASSANKAMNFEAQMDSVASLDKTIAKGTQGYAQMQALALEMGAKTKYSALEAAQGMEELVKAGMSVKQIKEGGGLEAALNLATAGGLDLSEAAEVMSTSLNAYKSDALSAADAANILAGTANASATGVHELKYSFAAVSAVAAGVGMTFRDTSIALGLFANNGIKGSDAGTSLKTMLGNLQPTTKTQIALFEKLGLLTADGANKFYDAKGNLQDLGSIAGTLQNSMKGLTAQQRSLALETMFGSDAVRAGNILFKEGAAGVAKFSTALSEAPTALQVATAKMDNAKGAVEMFDSAMETLQISALLPTMPLIKKLALASADFAAKLTVWLSSDQAKSWGDTIKSTIGGVRTAIEGFGKIVSGDTLGGISDLFSVGMNTDQVSGITQVASSIKSAFQQIQLAAIPLRTYFSDTFSQMGTSFSAIGAAMAPVLPVLISGIATIITTLMSLFAATAPVRDALTGLAVTVATMFAQYWPSMVALVQTVWGNLQPIFNMFKAVLGVIGAAVTMLGDVWAYIFPSIYAMVQKVAPPVTKLIGGIADIITSLINAVVKPLIPVLGTVLKTTWDIIKPILNFMLDMFLNLVDGLQQVVDGAKAMGSQLSKLKDIKIGAPEWLGGNGLIQTSTTEQPSSHAGGLSNVPYNGYLARLHKGEEVLTPEAASARRSGAGSGAYTFGDIHIHGSSGSPEEMADQFMSIVAQRIAEAGNQM